MRTKISQREARRLRRRVGELEQAELTRYSRWASGYPGGVHVASIDLSDNSWRVFAAKLDTAIALGYALVAKRDGINVRFYAVK